MLGTSFELVLLMVIAALAGVAALFAALCFFRMRPQGSALTEQTAGRILRSETDIVRGAVEDQARGFSHPMAPLRQGRRSADRSTTPWSRPSPGPSAGADPQSTLRNQHHNFFPLIDL